MLNKNKRSEKGEDLEKGMEVKVYGNNYNWTEFAS
jgi:hypothetical protein